MVNERQFGNVLRQSCHGVTAYNFCRNYLRINLYNLVKHKIAS